MEFLETLYNEIIGFLGISQAWEILKTGDYSAFRTYDGIVALIYPLIPLLVLLELILGLIYKKPDTKVYKVNFLIYIFNRFVGRFIAIAMVTLCIGLFQKYAPFQTEMTWYWFIYGYIVWEFAHFLYHYWGHKVRLFLVFAFHPPCSRKHESLGYLRSLFSRSAIRRYHSNHCLYSTWGAARATFLDNVY